MDDRIAISRIKQGDLDGLEARVNRYTVRAVHAAPSILDRLFEIFGVKEKTKEEPKKDRN